MTEKEKEMIAEYKESHNDEVNEEAFLSFARQVPHATASEIVNCVIDVDLTLNLDDGEYFADQLFKNYQEDFKKTDLKGFLGFVKSLRYLGDNEGDAIYELAEMMDLDLTFDENGSCEEELDDFDDIYLVDIGKKQYFLG